MTSLPDSAQSRNPRRLARSHLFTLPETPTVPRFAALSRGAALIVLSDGLERGDPTAMADAVARLARLCWRIIWLTPLAADPAFAALDSRSETGRVLMCLGPCPAAN